jgi:hypothetical protein
MLCASLPYHHMSARHLSDFIMELTASSSAADHFDFPFFKHIATNSHRVNSYSKRRPSPFSIMAGTGSSSPFIKGEPDDQLFGAGHNQRYMGTGQQFNIQQQHFNNAHNGGSINPNELTMMNGSYIPNSLQNNFPTHVSSANASFIKGISHLDDDDLLESLGNFQDQHINPSGMQNNHQNFNTIDDYDFSMPQQMYPGQNGSAGLPIDHQRLNNIYSNTPDTDPPIASPFNRGNFTMQQQQLLQLQQQQQFGNTLHSPGSFPGSAPHGDMHNGSLDSSYMNAKARAARPSLTAMQRKSSNPRSPLTPKTPGINVQSLNLNDPGPFATQPIRTTHTRQQKHASGTWDPQSAGSLTSFPGSGFSSPLQAGLHANAGIADILKTGSLPPNLNSSAQGGNAPAMQTQEMKRRRRRESHNLVERRRRDNINERIQELSHLVPMHRLEDEKVRKALQNNSPLSPTLGSTSMSPPQATSGLAGPGGRRATAGNITTGIPMEEKDKGPNKGDILNGAVSWTRDLMWMLHVKMQQQEELANIIKDLGGQYPFEATEDEKRMQSELAEAINKNNVANFTYSRSHGSGLRVPKFTDVKGTPLGGQPLGGEAENSSLSPDLDTPGGDGGQAGMGGPGQYWSGHNSGGSGEGSVEFKEEDEYMDLGQ